MMKPKEPRFDGLPEVTIYTDGGCIPNPGDGGWAAVLYCNGVEKRLAGGMARTTNNRMELLAVIKGLSALTKRCAVTLHTDSKYVQQGMTEWLPGWKRRGWVSAGGKPIKNQDLWMELDAVAGRHVVQFRWVKGHNGDPGNELADKLANAAITSMEAL